MIIKGSKPVWGAYSDGHDGSHRITVHDTKEEALEALDRTEEELEDGSPYDDGVLIAEILEFSFDTETQQLTFNNQLSFDTDG